MHSILTLLSSHIKEVVVVFEWEDRANNLRFYGVMERVAEDDHPLAPTAPLSISTNYGQQQQQQQHYRSYRTPSASLIHSAVRSVLDDATPNSTIISDDQSETSGLPGEYAASPRFWTNSHHQQQQASSPTLESLQTERVPPIPDKQDRKRFIVSTYMLTVGVVSLDSSSL